MRTAKITKTVETSEDLAKMAWVPTLVHNGTVYYNAIRVAILLGYSSENIMVEALGADHEFRFVAPISGKNYVSFYPISEIRRFIKFTNKVSDLKIKFTSEKSIWKRRDILEKFLGAKDPMPMYKTKVISKKRKSLEGERESEKPVNEKGIGIFSWLNSFLLKMRNKYGW